MDPAKSALLHLSGVLGLEATASTGVVAAPMCVLVEATRWIGEDYGRCRELSGTKGDRR